MRALLLSIGPDLCALPIDRAREVVPRPAVIKLPCASEVVLGVFNLRGDVVVLLDTGRVLGLTPVPDPSFVVLAASNGEPLGLAVSQEPQIAELGEAIGESTLRHGITRHQVGDAVATLIDVDGALVISEPAIA